MWAWSALRRAHRWLGWGVAAWLILMAASGTALLFKPRLKVLTAPPCPAGPSRPLAEALGAIDGAFPGKVRRVLPASGGFCLHEVVFRNDAGGAYVNPVSLRPVRVWGRDGRAVDAILDLHRALLLGGRGKAAVTVLALSTLALVLGGAFLALRRPSALSLRVWPLAATPGALLSSHRNLGILLALPLSFMAVTGLAMTYPKAAQAIIARAVGEHPAPRPVAAREVGPIAWKAALTTADAAFPGLQPRAVSWPARPGGPIEVRFRQAGEWSTGGQSVATVTPVSARLIARGDARKGSRATRIWDAVHPLHAGQAPAWIEVVVLVCVAASLMLSVAFAISSHWRRLGCSRNRARQARGRPLIRLS
jgi:vanillate O-demethylase ferredoxin subunit